MATHSLLIFGLKAKSVGVAYLRAGGTAEEEYNTPGIGTREQKAVRLAYFVGAWQYIVGIHL